MKYFLYFVIIFISSLSASAQIHDRIMSAEGYSVSEFPSGCESYDCTALLVLDRAKKVVFTIDKTFSNHYRPYEIRENILFYLVRTTDSNSNKNWEDQIWRLDLKTQHKEKVIGAQGLDYSSSPDGQQIVYHKGNELFLMDFRDHSIKKIASSTDGKAPEGYDVIDWSSDGTKFWFGSACNCPDSWSKIALYENKKTRWFDYEGYDDGFLDTNRGWLIYGEMPFQFDVISAKEYEKAGGEDTLNVIDIFSGKKAVIATAKANSYSPHWSKDKKTLEYKIQDKINRITVEEILKKLK